MIVTHEKDVHQHATRPDVARGPVKARRQHLRSNVPEAKWKSQRSTIKAIRLQMKSMSTKSISLKIFLRTLSCFFCAHGVTVSSVG